MSEEKTTPIGGSDYGTLSVEDDAGGTIDPADLAGTGKPEDAQVGYQPEESLDDGA
jgi:hypothetical protein